MILAFTIIIPVPLILAAISGILLVIWILRMGIKRRKFQEDYKDALEALTSHILTASAPKKILGDCWIHLYRQLREVTGDMIRYEIVRRFCHRRNIRIDPRQT